MSEPTTLADRLAGLHPAIDPALRDEFRRLGGTLSGGNPHAALLHTSRLTLRVFQLVYRDAGHAWPSDNLFDVIVTAGPWKDAARKAPGHGFLPDHLASASHTIRVVSNKVDHAAEPVPVSAEEAEGAANYLLAVARWYYCHFDRCATPLPSLYAAPAPPPPSVSSIPDFDTPFFGREDDVARLRDRFRPAGGGRAAGVVTVTGTGGIGKTRLACEVARGLVPDFPGGCHLVELKDLETATDVAAAVAEALGYRLGDGDRDAARALAQLLRDRPETLLVLDNFEHLSAAVDGTVRVWRGRAPQVRVLVTSRTPLGLDGEVEHPLGPLPVPSYADLDAGRLDAVFATDAARLFREAARGRAGGADGATALAVARVCTLLDGQPLPLILVARRLDEYDLFDLLAELETDRVRTAQAGGKSLWEVIRWSYDLLRPHERDGFRRLAVFREGFTRAAGLDVLAGVPCPPGANPAAVLRRLRECSLVELVRRPGRPDRYKMFQTVQDFARAQWESPGAVAADLGGAWVAHFDRLVGEWGPRVGTGDGKAALDVLAEERENVLAAADWAGANGRPAEAVRLLLGFADVLALRGPWQVRADLFRAAADRLGAGDPAVRSDFLCALAEALWSEGRHTEAHAAAEEALALARRAGGPDRVAWALLAAGRCAGHAGVEGRCQECLEEGVRHSEQAGLRVAAAAHRANLAYQFDRAGDYPTAVPLAARAVAELESVGTSRQLARAVNMHGLVLWHAGDPERALDCFDRAGRLFREYDDPRWEAGTVTNRGLALIDLDRLAEAVDRFRAAGPLHLAQGNVSWWAVNQGGLGLAQLLAGDPAAAATLTAARDRAAQTRYEENVAMIDGYLGRAALRAGDPAAAADHFGRALGYEARVGARDARHVGNRLNRAAALLALGRLDEARADYAAGIREADRLGLRPDSAVRLVRDDMVLAARLAGELA